MRTELLYTAELTLQGVTHEVGDAYLLEGALEQQGLQSGVQLLTHPLQKHRVAKLDGVFQPAHIVRLTQLEHFQLAAPLHILDPLVGLALQPIVEVHIRFRCNLDA